MWPPSPYSIALLCWRKMSRSMARGSHRPQTKSAADFAIFRVSWTSARKTVPFARAANSVGRAPVAGGAHPYSVDGAARRARFSGNAFGARTTFEKSGARCWNSAQLGKPGGNRCAAPSFAAALSSGVAGYQRAP